MLVTHAKSLFAAVSVALASVMWVAPPAVADEASGVIRGIVLETGRVIAPGIDVSLYRTTGEFVEATVTNSTAGAYEFSGLEAGSYTLWFENQNEAVSEWYDNKPDKPQATAIQLGEGATFIADAYLTQISENLVRPSLSGTPAVGSTLAANVGIWYPTESVEFRHQWLRDGSPITGATQSTYQIVAADQGASIAVSVIAVSQGATESAESAALTVPGGTIANLTLPTITGSTNSGATLTATTGTWLPSSAAIELEWLRGPAVVGTGPTYVTGAADIGAQITVRATASRANWTSTIATSAPFGPITAPPVVVTPPSVQSPPGLLGTAQVGRTLTAKPGTWSGRPTLTYQWLRNGAPIAGATATSYRVSVKDAKTRISVLVRATNTAATSTATSPAITVAPATSKVSVSAKSPRKRRLTVKAVVTSAGSRTGTVTIRAKVGKRTVTKKVKLKNGRGTVTITKLPKGSATVTVTYSGDRSSAPAKATKKKVRVR